MNISEKLFEISQNYFEFLDKREHTFEREYVYVQCFIQKSYIAIEQLKNQASDFAVIDFARTI